MEDVDHRGNARHADCCQAGRERLDWLQASDDDRKDTPPAKNRRSTFERAAFVGYFALRRALLGAGVIATTLPEEARCESR